MATLSLQRHFQTDREDLFRAWIDPDALCKWFLPESGAVLEKAEVRAEPGGSMRLRWNFPDGRTTDAAARFVDFDYPVRMQWLLHVGATECGDDDPRVALDFQPHPVDGVELKIDHHDVEDAERDELETAWIRLLDSLDQFLDGNLDSKRDVFFERVTRANVHRSRFGGLWPDLRNAETLLEGKVECGLLTKKEGKLFRDWIQNGYVVLEGAIDKKQIDRFLQDYDRVWSQNDPELFVEYYRDGDVRFHPVEERFRDEPHKILDMHGYSRAARKMICAPAVVNFLSKLFERPPLAFMSLLFLYGTEQEMHQDSAFVPVSSPLEFVGSWIALEDIQPDTGELQYFEGSHRLPEFVWFDRARAMPYNYRNLTPFYDHVRDTPPKLGMPLRKFTPKKGDILLWHADLVHGGSKNPNPDRTRKSFVTHWCPKDVDPEYTADIPWSGKLKAENGAYYCHKRRGI